MKLRERTAAWWSRVKIDGADAHLLDDYSVSLACQRGRPARLRAEDRSTGERYQLSRLVMNPPDTLVVDHINGDIFDNRRSNLRVCTKRENGWSQRSRGGQSRFKGVSPWRKKWEARVGGAYIGIFATEEEAALAHDRAARERYGQFATLNFPGPGEVSGLIYGEAA